MESLKLCIFNVYKSSRNFKPWALFSSLLASFVPQLTFLLQALSVSQVVLGFALMYVFVWSYVCCSVLLLWGRVCFDSCVSMLCHV